MLKNRPKMSQKIYRNQNALGSPTIIPCHTNISLTTERELRETSLKKLLYKRGRGRIDDKRLR